MDGATAEQPQVIDVTTELLGERRQEWRDGAEFGRRQEWQRVLQSEALAQIALELKLLRATAQSLGEQVDYWREKSDEFALDAEYWHSVAARTA